MRVISTLVLLYSIFCLKFFFFIVATSQCSILVTDHPLCVSTYIWCMSSGKSILFLPLNFSCVLLLTVCVYMHLQCLILIADHFYIFLTTVHAYMHCWCLILAGDHPCMSYSQFVHICISSVSFLSLTVLCVFLSTVHVYL